MGGKGHIVRSNRYKHGMMRSGGAGRIVPQLHNYVRRGETVNTFRHQLNGDHRHCPRCDRLLLRDSWDLYCLACGWRESYYFGGEPMEMPGDFGREPVLSGEPLYRIVGGVPVRVDPDFC